MWAPSAPLQALVTDVEGTTSAIDFVHRVLFPYARAALPEFVATHAEDPQVAPWLAQVRAESGNDDVVAELQAWIDADRKHTALKALQGMIWRSAFEQGVFRSHVYADAVAALRRWHAAGLPLYVYSSGSIEAQRLYFRHTEAGDLSDLFSGHFDTTSGPKRDSASYHHIAAAIGQPAASLLFLSDVEAELDAASAAGWQVLQIVRAGTEASLRHPWVDSFDQVRLPAIDPR